MMIFLFPLNVLLCLFLFFATAILAQQPKPAANEAIKINTDLVVLDAQILRKKDGVAVASLKRENFTLYEDGVRQEITHFSQDKLPLSILLLLDLSASVKPVIEEIRNGALGALRQLRPEDEVAVMTFADRTELLHDFTKDRKAVIDQVSRVLEKRFVGVGTSLHTALYEAALQMDHAVSPLSRRVIITVTDDIATMHRFTNPTINEVNERLLEHSSVVCGLVIGGPTSKTLNIFLREHKDVYNWKVKIDDFAEPTGGEVIITNAHDVNQKLAEMISHLRVRYSLGYTPLMVSADGRFRRIMLNVTDEVQKREGQIIIKTRQGYFARQSQPLQKPD
ncbi:MAG: VWA domain-containing protein [Acidobacteriota bacterium]|nr:VWA domain-containing protein [Acidobacteriota bacterium]